MLRLNKENRPVFFACLAVTGLTLLLLQLWPTNTNNPPIVSTPEWSDEQSQQLVERACYDCHSHETDWPWYTNVVPAYFLLTNDVTRGREVLNFSRWEETCCTEAQIEKMAITVTKNHMPLPYYVVLHPESRLTDLERGQIVYGLMETMAGNVIQD
jgi:hypothetical protein